MSKFDNLMKRPLPSRCDELSKYLYEYAEGNGESTEDICIIGFYTDEYLPECISEETLIRDLNFKGKIKSAMIEMRSNEGWEKPHVHVKNEYFNCAIRLDVPEYFKHPHANDTFQNKNQKKIFNDFMSSKTYNGDETYWDFCKRLFNMHYGPLGHPMKCDKQPDYTKLQ